jgi:hypothetical protein
VGVVGESLSDHGVTGSTPSGGSAGVAGTNTALAGGIGVSGAATGSDGTGVSGTSAAGGTGVRGSSDDGVGCGGDSVTGNGVEGTTRDGVGVYGWVVAAEQDERQDDGQDRQGERRGSGMGVLGIAGSGNGVQGQSSEGTGLWGGSDTGEGVHGQTWSRSASAVVGLQLEPASIGAAIYGEHKGPDGMAGFFRGNVGVTGHLEFVGADCAEEFALLEATAVEPGTVLVIGDDEALCESRAAYDRRVAGVVSGAGDVHPGLVLGADLGFGQRSPVPAARARVALVGRVWCKVDAGEGPIEVGDLLTTAARPGHAMAASDPQRTLGSVLGKALRPLRSGTGLIPILVSLQ